MLQYNPLKRQPAGAVEQVVEVCAGIARDDVQHPIGETSDVLEQLATLVQGELQHRAPVTGQQVERHEGQRFRGAFDEIAPARP